MKLEKDFTGDRLSLDKILEQNTSFKNNQLGLSLLSSIPYTIVVINRERQVIYSTEKLFDFLGTSTSKDVNGLRLGEVFSCLNSNETPGGCGTSEKCSLCGAMATILKSQQSSEAVTSECIINRNINNEIIPVDLEINAAPIGEGYTLIVIKDISAEKRRRIFERVFFHDILNTSGAVNSMLTLALKANSLEESNELLNYAKDGIEVLIDEILSQKELQAAENKSLLVKPVTVYPAAILSKLSEYYIKNNERHIATEIPDVNIFFKADPVLLRRVLNNMLKNALEASRKNEVVTIGYRLLAGEIEFFVHNPQYMEKSIQGQLFNRSFSTKGPGRGIGTYSMKILGEIYLKGSVYFESNPSDGTTFFFRLPLKKEQNQQ